MASKIFVLKVAGGHEKNIAESIAERVKTKGLPIFSIIYASKMKGYLLIEAEKINVVADLSTGTKNVRSTVPGLMKVSDIQSIIKPMEVEMSFAEGQVVEVITGPFKGMKARIVRFDKDKKEATVSLLDTRYQLQVTIDGSYLKGS